MTNNNKETFESKITKYLETLKNQSKIKLDYHTVELDTMDVEELKQLHDTEIRQLIAEKDMIIDINREKDNKIKELQAEITNLKDTNKYWKRRAENKNKKVMKKKQKTDFEQLNHDRVAYRLQH